MKEFTKIAVGLLGLTHPEMFIRRRGPDPASTPPAATPSRRASGARFLRSFRFVVAALAIGSRAVPLADHGELVKDLRTHAGLLYGPDES
jgi:hypothetical protein